MNTIRLVYPKIKSKLKEYLVYRKEKIKVSEVTSILLKIFSLPALLSLSFVLADISFLKKTADVFFNKHFYIFSISSLVVIIIFIADLFAMYFEASEDYAEKLEKMYSEACRGNVFQVHEEMELDGEKFVVPFFYNGAVSAKFAKALNNAEVKLEKKKGLYNFLAKILFCEQR